MVGFLLGLVINLALQIGLNALSRLLEPGRKRSPPRPFESPTASSGQPLGKGFGVFEAHPAIVLVHEPALQQDKHGDLDVTRYYAKMQFVLGWGPINVLYDIISDERSLRLQIPGREQSFDDHPDVPPDPNIIFPALPFDFDATPAAGVEFSINARQMYGGGGEEGGIQGLLMLYPGTGDQPIDPLTQEIDGLFASAYPWTIYVRLGAEKGRLKGISTAGANQQGDKFYLSTNVPTPKPISFLLGTYPDELLGDGGRIGIAANAVEVLYSLRTDRKWGAKNPVARFDIAQWTEKAQQLKNENIGIAVPQDEPRTLDDIEEDILRHIDGGIVEDPITGLLQIKLARSDYVFDDLLTVGAHNTENFKRGKPLAPKSINDIQVRYRRFHGGITGNVTDEIVTTNAHLLNYTFGATPKSFPYKSAGDKLIPDSIHVFVDAVEVAVNTTWNYNDGDQVVVNPETGVWWFIEGANVVEGAEIRISYAAEPTFVAFVDDVATAQNIASQRARQQQPESYDYTYYIDPLSAQWKADRLRATLSRAIDTFTWEGKRDQSHLTPWDVVKLVEPAWGITDPVAIRITKVSRGTRTNPRLTFEGVKDIWGEEILLSSVNLQPPIGVSKLPAPVMGIGCGMGGSGVSRIDLFPTDTIFAVEVWEADDEIGFEATLVATIPAGTSPMFYDGVVSKFYSARQISLFTLPGPFTPWITCAGIEPPTDPTCTLPTYTYDADDLAGIIILALLDPQNRVSLVEYRTRNGNGAWSAWVSEGSPYCFSVILSATEISRIEWRITYLACNGSTQQYLDGYDFVPFIPEPEPEPEPEPALGSLAIDIALHAGATVPLELVEIPAERIPLTNWRGTERKYPFDQVQAGRVELIVTESTLDPGTYVAIEGEVPDTPGVWRPLDPDGGPVIPVDPDSLDALDENTDEDVWVVAGDWFPHRLELRDDIRIRAMIGGGDGDPAKGIVLAQVSYQPVAQAVGGPPPETEPPKEEDPGSCDVPGILDDFSYGDVTALDAAWPED